MENENSEQFQNINEKLQSQKINEKLNASLESQAIKLGKAIDDATRGLISGIKTSNSKYVDELDVIKGNILDSVQKATSGGNLDMDIDKSISLSSLMGDMSKIDNLNMVLAFKFLKVKNNILKSVDTATKGGNLDIDIDSSMKLSELLGESPKLNLVHAFRWLRIKKNILEKVEAATESVELEIDRKMSLNDILGSTPDQDILTKTRFFLIRQGLLKKISKAAKDFDPQESVDNITGGLGGGTPTAEGTPAAPVESITPAAPVEGAPALATSSVIPPDALDAITKTSSSLETLVESSKGDVLQDRENRKEDIAREKKRTSALSNLTGGKNVVAAGKEKAGGMINSVKDGIKSRLGFGGGGRAGGATGKAAGAGIGGTIAGVGKGVGEGISGFMKSLGKGLKALADKKYFISAGVLIALGGALFVTGKALKEFVGLDFKSIAIGVVTLGALAVMAKLIGKAAKEIFIGSLAIAALGASLIPAGFAFGMFSDINWAGVGIGIGVLVALGAAAFGLSFIAPAILIGAAAIAVLGAALIPAAFAFDIFGTALQKITPFFTVFADAISTVIGAVGNFLTNFVDSLSKLGDAGPGLLIAAAGIGAVSAALIAFSAAAAVGGIMSFFSGDPVKKFIELGKVAPDLATASNSIDKLSDSIQNFDTGEPDKLEEFVDQIKRLSKLKLKTVAKVMQHISEISGTASAPANVLPAGSAIEQTAAMTAAAGGAAAGAVGSVPSMKSTVPQLEQKNTPRSGEIKDDGVVTKEYIEASLAKEKAEKELNSFVAEGKSSKMVFIDDELGGYDERVYDNEEDQARFKELKKANAQADKRKREERKNIVGTDRRGQADNFGFAFDNFDPTGDDRFTVDDKGNKTGFSSSGFMLPVEVDRFLEARVDKVRAQQAAMLKPESDSVEQIETQSGNKLDMSSRQNEADKSASKNGDGQTLNNVVNNKEGDTTQVTNTTINAQPHVDRTLDFLQPRFY